MVICTHFLLSLYVGKNTALMQIEYVWDRFDVRENGFYKKGCDVNECGINNSTKMNSRLELFLVSIKISATCQTAKYISIGGMLLT